MKRLCYIVLLVFSAAFIAEAQNSNRYYQSSHIEEGMLVIEVNDGQIHITPLTQNAMEVAFVSGHSTNPASYALQGSAQAVKTTLNDTDEYLEFATSGITTRVTKSPFQISYSYHDQPLISEEQGYFENETYRGFRLTLEKDEKLMGGGERVLGMDRRGNRLPLYNKASYGYETHAEQMYYSMPVVISSKKYMLVFDNAASGFLDLGATEKDVLQFEAVGGRMSYLVVAAESWDQLPVHYTEITGRQPMLPRWALGNIASRFGYHSQREVLEVAQKYIEDEIPVDAIVLDLYWFGKEVTGTMGNLEWDTDSFPNPDAMLSQLKDMGIKTILITEPFILTTSGKYKECDELGILGKDSLGQTYTYDFFFGNTGLIDIFNPEAKDWFWDIYKKHTLLGVAGWWGDLGEPEVHPDDLLHVNGRADEVHNAYGHEWAKTVYEGFAKDFPNQRPVILMRAGFAGTQRYGMVPWTGDVNRTWGGFKPQVELALQMGMQGLAYTHSDLGGFAGDYEDAELYTRWLQYGVFQPIYRPHAQEEVPSEPIFWDDTTKNIVRSYINLRYQLLPYLYTLTFENSTTGMPLMRPLFYMDEDPKLLDEKQSYLWGDNFLVTPVTEKGATQQRVVFPKGANWYNFWTDEKVKGGQEKNVPVDLETLPVFVKGGAFIPMTDAVQNTEQYATQNLSLHYYFDKEVPVSKGYVYEDDGHTKDAYTKKQYEIIRFTADGQQITIVPEGYTYEGKPDSKQLQLVIHNLDKMPRKIRLNGMEMRVKKKNKHLENYSWHNKEKRCLTISTTLKTEQLNIEF